MVKVYFLVEGQTEETFVESVLQAHFNRREIHLYPILVGESRHKGGIGHYSRACDHILRTLKQEAGTFCTTMFDYYRMPPKSWPKRREASHKPFTEKAAMIEAAMKGARKD